MHVPHNSIIFHHYMYPTPVQNWHRDGVITAAQCEGPCDWAEADRQWEHTRGSSYLPSPSPLCLPAGHTQARWLAAVSPHHFDLVYSLALNGTLLRPCDQCQSVKPLGECRLCGSVYPSSLLPVWHGAQRPSPICRPPPPPPPHPARSTC